MTRIPRFLLMVSAVILLFGAAVHTRAFNGALAVVANSTLPAFYGNALKALWLIDSATLGILGILFGLIGFRPTITSGMIILLLALIPAASAILLYYFIGTFVPAHMLLTAAILAFMAGLFRATT